LEKKLPSSVRGFFRRVRKLGGARQYCYGYRYGEVKLDPIGDIKDDAKISEPREVDSEKRPPVQVSLGCHVVDAACPHPCLSDPDTAAAGARKRFCCKPPLAKPTELYNFRRFVRCWIRENLVALPHDSDVSVEAWLERTNYPQWRKDELREAWDAVEDIWDPEKARKYFSCSSFVKDEVYPTYKHARSINSRSDAFKCAVGPIFKLIEEQVFNHPAFIKHVPMDQRPEYIFQRLHSEGAKYFATDYTAFESQFVAELMSACEFELYEFMTAHLPSGDDFMRLVRGVIGGLNVCKFRDFVAELSATRMSGEMCTSLGNGFSNLMFMLYTCQKVGCTNVIGVVEGDDGLFTMVGNPPTKEDFAELGLIIKAECHTKLETASFCGMVFDLEDRRIITDPRKVLATFGWTSRQYAHVRPHKLRQLLRCKALSLMYQYPGCPVVCAIARYGLRVTPNADAKKGLTQRKLSTWERDRAEYAIANASRFENVEVGRNSRYLVEELYGITVDQQIAIENYLDSLQVLQPIGGPISDIMPQEWQDYFGTYSSVVDRTCPLMSFPIAERWPKMAGFRKEW